MKSNWRVLGLVVARGGSKGLPRKNLRPLLGKPLIKWSIIAGLNSPSLDSIVLSTDDDEIAKVARESGARVPFMRPAELAGDAASSVDVVLHAIDWLAAAGEHYDVVVLLEPTSPQRESDDIEAVLDIMDRTKSSAVVSVCRSESMHPSFMFHKNESERLQPFMEFQPTNLRRQEIDQLYFLDGTVYASNITALRKHKSFYHDDTACYEVPKWKSFEIDDLDDFLIVEALLKSKKGL